MREPEMTQELQAELHQGVLVRFFGGFYVAADADGQEYTLRCPKKFRHQRLSPLVGDAVRFTPGQGEEEGWLVEILPRKTECIRPPVANVTLLLVSICPSPEPDLLLVDRLLARAKKQGMKTALIVGKCDLDGGKLLAQMQEEYRGADCPVLGVSARNKEGLDSVRALMRGADCCCLAGQSGVGKSTLLNALLDLQLETGEISEKIQRGKNTTRYAQLLIHDGIRVLDTAGFSLLETEKGMEPEKLQELYPEFQPYIGQCRFQPCLHDCEPGCAVTQAVQAGGNDGDRGGPHRGPLGDVRLAWKNRYQ